VRTWHWLLMAAAFFAALIAVVLGAGGSELNDAAHLSAAAYGVLAGTAIVWAAIERASREPTRYPYFLMAGIGTGIVLFGQSLGYLVTSSLPGPFDPRVEALPLLIGMPVAAIGAVLLAWPRGMSRREYVLVGIDSALGLLALWFVWIEVVIPRWAWPADQALEVVVALDQIALFLGSALVIVLMVASRRLGSLPLPQLILLLGGVLVWLISDLVGELGPDRSSGITISIIGYTVATSLLVAMSHRSAAETESPRETRWRDGLSLLLPMILVLIGGLVVIASATELSTGPRALSAITFVGVLAGLTYARVVTLQDLRNSQNRVMVQNLAESAARGWVGTLLRDSAEYVLVLDAGGQIVFASPRTRSDLAQGQRFGDIVLDPGAGEIDMILAGVAARSVPAGPHEMLLRDSNSGQREVEVFVRAVSDIDFEGFVVTGTDVTDARRLAQSLDRTRRRDGLTGLLTPEAIAAEVAAALATSGPSHHGVLFAELDITDFGTWNDSLGRQGGDEILQAVAKQFEGLPPEVVAVSRMGGDAFGLLMTSASPVTTLEQVVDWVRRCFAGLILPSDREVDLGFRLGYSVADPGATADPAHLMEQADVALRRARKSRQAQVVRFRPGMNEDLVSRLSAELRVREALNADAIIVHYQPIVGLRDGVVRSVEALARIRAPHGGIVGPDSFMDAAEHSGLVKDIDLHVRRHVAADWPVIAAATSDDLRININVSQQELNPDLATELQRTGLTRRVVIEVTEATVLTNPKVARQTLESIRQVGGVVAIDDFGTGYSSLSQIVSLPCDVLKIDRSFISDMSETSATSSLVRAMVQLADDLGLRTVAEGVETAQQAAILRAIGCDRAQGFHYAPPLPLPELLLWITQHSVPARQVRSPAAPTT
jgi:diguanylate cyclase (GGDEF)-like protein